MSLKLILTSGVWECKGLGMYKKFIWEGNSVNVLVMIGKTAWKKKR